MQKLDSWKPKATLALQLRVFASWVVELDILCRFWVFVLFFTLCSPSSDVFCLFIASSQQPSCQSVKSALVNEVQVQRIEIDIFVLGILARVIFPILTSAH